MNILLLGVARVIVALCQVQLLPRDLMLIFLLALWQDVWLSLYHLLVEVTRSSDVISKEIIHTLRHKCWFIYLHHRSLHYPSSKTPESLTKSKSNKKNELIPIILLSHSPANTFSHGQTDKHFDEKKESHWTCWRGRGLEKNLEENVLICLVFISV